MKPKQPYCARCGADIWVLPCGNCGAANPSVRLCPKCGRAFSPGPTHSCRSCGLELNKSHHEEADESGRDTGTPSCRKCGALFRGRERFCTHCRAPNTNVRHCPKCDLWFTRGERFCGDCGRTLKAPALPTGCVTKWLRLGCGTVFGTILFICLIYALAGGR